MLRMLGQIGFKNLRCMRAFTCERADHRLAKNQYRSVRILPEPFLNRGHGSLELLGLNLTVNPLSVDFRLLAAELVLFAAAAITLRIGFHIDWLSRSFDFRAFGPSRHQRATQGIPRNRPSQILMITTLCARDALSVIFLSLKHLKFGEIPGTASFRKSSGDGLYGLENHIRKIPNRL